MRLERFFKVKTQTVLELPKMKLSFSLIALVAANSLSMNREGALLEGKDSVDFNAVPAR